MGTGRIEGKRAIITGAGSGIGKATALRFAREGARVALIDIDGPALERTLTAIRETGGDAVSFTTDVTREDQVSAAVQGTADEFGGLDVIVSNAGVELIGQDGRVHELDTAAWHKTLDINLTGMFLICKYGVRELLKTGGGSVNLYRFTHGVRRAGRGNHRVQCKQRGRACPHPRHGTRLCGR